MRKFLYGVLVGATIMGGVHVALDLYSDLNRRLGAVEGYLQQLDRIMRQGSNDVAPAADRVRA
jgi:hypothetical protein